MRYYFEIKQCRKVSLSGNKKPLSCSNDVAIAVLNPRKCSRHLYVVNTFSHFGMPCVRDATLSLLHVPATRPCYMSSMCEQRTILWLQHVAEICPCVITPRVRAGMGGGGC